MRKAIITQALELTKVKSCSFLRTWTTSAGSWESAHWFTGVQAPNSSGDFGIILCITLYSKDGEVSMTMITACFLMSIPKTTLEVIGAVMYCIWKPEMSFRRITGVDLYAYQCCVCFIVVDKWQNSCSTSKTQYASTVSLWTQYETPFLISKQSLMQPVIQFPTTMNYHVIVSNTWLCVRPPSVCHFLLSMTQGIEDVIIAQLTRSP